MFCRLPKRHRREINMAIVLRMTLVFAIMTTIRVDARSTSSSSNQSFQTAFVNAVAGVTTSSSSSTTTTTTTDEEPPSQFIESNSIQRHIEHTSGRSISDSRSLKRVFLSNRTVTCNDGSQAGFYLRRSIKSKRWVVFFEGGWHCYDTESCKTRWTKFRHLMTSAKWPETRDDVGGILSPVSAENPFWHDANHILVPYCSSDSWSGTRVRAKDRFSFMGSLIVRQVIADLIPLGLGRSQGGELLLAGSSAGGLGVMLNLDRVKKFLREERSIKMSVRGVSDSGWFLDREPYAPGAISGSDVVKQGHTLWEAALPEACLAAHQSEPWRCYFGHRIYPTLKAPLFVFQWLFDEAQMRADSVGAPVTKKQWDYIHETGIALRASLDNVTAVFAPSCIGHSVLTKRDWLNIKIDEYSLPEALRCWETSTGPKRQGANKELSRRASDGKKKLSEKQLKQRERRQKNRDRRRRKKQRQQERRERQEYNRQQREHQRREQQQKRNGGVKNLRHQNNNRNNNNTEITSTPAATTIARSERSPVVNNTSNKDLEKLNSNNSSSMNRNGNNKRRNSNNNNSNNNNNHQNSDNPRKTNHKRQRQYDRRQAKQVVVQEPSRCALRLLERCSWPQCNHSCPSITNPMTGKEMRFLELLASFGLDIEAVATALGVDMTTLSNMDRAELLNLLTQTS